MPSKPRDLIHCLQRKLGFTARQGDHIWLELTLPNQHIVRTKIGRHSKDYGDTLLAMVARQLHIRKDFFQGVLDCYRSREDYLKQVQNDPFPPWD